MKQQIPIFLDTEFNQEKPLETHVIDLTYILVGNRWSYVCLIIDLFNRKIIGVSVGWYKTSNLVKEAIQSTLTLLPKSRFSILIVVRISIS